MNLEETARQWADALINDYGHGQEAREVLERRVALLRDMVFAILSEDDEEHVTLEPLDARTFDQNCEDFELGFSAEDD